MKADRSRSTPAILVPTMMGDDPDLRTPDREQLRSFADDATDEPLISKQELAHDRGRICKKRGCVVCAPLREQRRLKKSQRRAEARALLHAKGQPCGRSNCSLTVCVDARAAAAAAPPPAAPPPVEPPVASPTGGSGIDAAGGDPDRTRRRQAERHRVGLPCGSEDCPDQACIDGFANERTRRHRAGRPCRSATCDNAICVAARSTN